MGFKDTSSTHFSWHLNFVSHNRSDSFRGYQSLPSSHIPSPSPSLRALTRKILGKDIGIPTLQQTTMAKPGWDKWVRPILTPSTVAKVDSVLRIWQLLFKLHNFKSTIFHPDHKDMRYVIKCLVKV